MAARDRDPPLLLAPGPQCPGELPHVPRRDRPRREPARDDARHPRVGRREERLRPHAEAEAPAGLPDARHRRPGSEERHQPERRRGASRGAGVSPPEPSRGLPHLRPVRRVQAPGLLARVPEDAQAPPRRACPQAEGRGLRSHHRLRRRALRDVHALHPLHGRSGEGPRARHARARQPERDHGLARAPARRQVHVHGRARVPGRCAHDGRLPLQSAGLVSADGDERVPGVRDGVQRVPRLRPALQQGVPLPPARQRAGQQVLDVRRRDADVPARARGAGHRADASRRPRGRDR